MIIRFSSLGDIVLTSLLVRCLKLQKQCEVHFLTKKSFESLLTSNPHIDKVWAFDKSLNTIIPALKAEGYDLIIDLHKNLRSRYVRLRLWKVAVVSYSKANISKWLAVYFKLIRFPKEHIAVRYLNSVKKFGVTDDGGGLDYFIPQQDQIDLSYQFGIDGDFYALVLGAAHFTKRLPVEKWKELISQLDPSKKIILIGGKDEQKLAAQFTGQNIYNACGFLSINQSASVLKQAHVIIAPDTGMMHIAAALKKPIRSIWGSTLAEFGFWPFYGNKNQDLNISFEVKGLTCRPCSRFGREACPKGHFKCMLDQDLKAIARSL